MSDMSSMLIRASLSEPHTNCYYEKNALLLNIDFNNVSETTSQQQLTRRERDRQRRAAETPEQRIRRLERMREYRKWKRETEALEQAEMRQSKQWKQDAVNLHPVYYNYTNTEPILNTPFEP